MKKVCKSVLISIENEQIQASLYKEVNRTEASPFRKDSLVATVNIRTITITTLRLTIAM
jgi:hypothetical protein